MSNQYQMDLKGFVSILLFWGIVNIKASALFHQIEVDKVMLFNEHRNPKTIYPRSSIQMQVGQNSNFFEEMTQKLQNDTMKIGNDIPMLFTFRPSFLAFAALSRAELRSEVNYYFNYGPFTATWLLQHKHFKMDSDVTAVRLMNRVTLPITNWFYNGPELKISSEQSEEYRVISSDILICMN